MASNFYSILFKMKYIDRWMLMKNMRSESLSEHTLETAYIAHALCVISNRRCNTKLNAAQAAVLALFHDAQEVLTGDLPTPIKYYNSQIKDAYSKIEKEATRRMVSMLPEDLHSDFQDIFCSQNKELLKIVKAADKISALIKCDDELRMGNEEFRVARESTRKAIEKMGLECVDIFMEEFLPGFSLSLDEQGLRF